MNSAFPDELGEIKKIVMKRPTVSVLIPSYNASPWLCQAIESALAQTYQPIEVCVIDDGSTDGSADLLRKFEGRVQWRARENRGGNPTRNELLAMSRGEWIQYLDADDYLEPDKVERQVQHLLALPDAANIDVLYSPVRTEYHDQRELVRIHPPVPPVSGDPWILHARWELTQTGGALFRRTSLEEVGAWNEEQACCQDNELFFRLLKAKKRFLHVPDAVAAYRRFEGGTVSTRKRAQVVDEILKLLDAAEQHLRDINQLDPTRLNAINHHRFWIARNIWPWAAKLSCEIMLQVRSSQPNFRPEPSRFAPAIYRICYRVFGFSISERIAAARRMITTLIK